MYKGDLVNYTENILIVDNVIANLVMLTAIIKNANLIPRPVSSAKQALQAINILMPNLILLNIYLPEIDGFELCVMLKENVLTRDIPVIFISSMYSTYDKIRGFKLGAVDFIAKPFEMEEVKLKVTTHLQMLRMKKELESYNRNIHKLVFDQIYKVTKDQKGLIYALANLLGSSNNTKGMHLANIRTNIRILTMGLQLSPKFAREISDSFIETIDLAASLHDIGKMTINDSILFKPDKLTSEEMEIIKTHAEVGANTLNEIYSYNEQNEYLMMAIDISYYHHEKWNGKGYPKGLTGKEIPLAARIMAVIDVYDALSSERCYKQIFSHEESLRIINEESGISFDPDIIDIFNRIEKQLKTGNGNVND